jgi:hypothetical protein
MVPLTLLVTPLIGSALSKEFCLLSLGYPHVHHVKGADHSWHLGWPLLERQWKVPSVLCHSADRQCRTFVFVKRQPTTQLSPQYHSCSSFNFPYTKPTHTHLFTSSRSLISAFWSLEVVSHRRPLARPPVNVRCSLLPSSCVTS